MTNLKTEVLALTALVALSGCSPAVVLTAEGCESADWYRIGTRDGYVDERSSLEEYQALCARADMRPDTVKYAKGLEAGQSDRRRQDEWR